MLSKSCLLFKKEVCSMGKIFSERFNQLFEESTLAQEEFGQRFGATKGQIYRWRTGTGEPDTEMLVTIADQCGVTLDWLLGRSEVRRPKEYEKAELGNLMEKVTDSMNTFKDELKKLNLRDKF